MKTAALSKVAEINPRPSSIAANVPVSFVGMAELNATTATAVTLDTRYYGDVSKGYTVFRNGDVLAAKITPCWENGKIGQAALDHAIGVGSTEFHVLRPGSELDDRYLLHFLRQSHIRDLGELRMTGSAGQRRVPAEFLRSLQIPLPPLAEQRRIAAILDQVDTLRAKRRHVLAHLGALPQAIFRDMFGADAEQTSLGAVVSFYSGATPSKARKEYWEGDLPWFSSKDLKAPDLWDSTDHLARQVTQQTPLKLLPPGTVAIGVRGMILAHTVPVTTLRVPATINQDLKALLPLVEVDVDFLAAAIRARSEWILARVSTAAHGTKKLDSTILESIPIPRADPSRQREFARRANKVRASRTAAQRAAAADDELFASLQAGAFRGNL
ncbi:restriction endonuclease subunit S [Branchiibius sp. NY16-3462-2]|uniref:restriction endonuclease subunit S n=1 Tax=Branchiibius sp. NY16-3462-2 TaxID=1807500 RepID=UPI00079CA6D9|nr:restriction endonuclease subunit S [Branchiibius sp. NY16-3462-2]KYH43990.1 hypothetical protein AZH51_04385 [Branchiibius sp. NY16-3462-2]